MYPIVFFLYSIGFIYLFFVCMGEESSSVESMAGRGATSFISGPQMASDAPLIFNRCEYKYRHSFESPVDIKRWESSWNASRLIGRTSRDRHVAGWFPWRPRRGGSWLAWPPPPLPPPPPPQCFLDTTCNDNSVTWNSVAESVVIQLEDYSRYGCNATYSNSITTSNCNAT